MTPTSTQSPIPEISEIEDLLVNNPLFEKIGSYLSRFNPIRTMKMERMEIRHSAILSWLLDPQETHGIGDSFLKAFLAEALRGSQPSGCPNALDILQSDLGDAFVRREWNNIDIFIASQRNNWVFIVENKFDSTQRLGQLSKYKEKIEDSHIGFDKAPILCGIFLTLNDEEPQDASFATIRYWSLCENLERLIAHPMRALLPEVQVFIGHYLEILKEATGLDSKLDEMKKLARRLYMDHRKVMDFIIEHGTSTDFAMAARSIIGEDRQRFSNVDIDGHQYIFTGLSSNGLSVLPLSWYDALGGQHYVWRGCEKWWAGFPLIVWFQIFGNPNGKGGRLRFNAEVGPLSNLEFRKSLIAKIQGVSRDGEKKLKIQFQSGAANEDRSYSRFFKDGSSSIEDMNDAQEIEQKMRHLLGKFRPEFDAVASVLHECLQYGERKQS